MRSALATVAALLLGAQTPPPERGIVLDELGGAALKETFARDPVVIVPIGRAAEPHPAHLKINADWRLVDRIRRRLAETPGVAVTAPVTHVPTGGSALDAAAFYADICRTLAQHGARRFLAIDVFRTGAVAAPATHAAGADGLLLAFEPALDADGRHGDRDETLMLLHLDPAGVIDKTAVAADPERGGTLTDGAIQRMLAAVAKLKATRLPPKRSLPRGVMLSSSGGPPRSGTEGDYRTIVRMGGLFGMYWRNHDALAIAELFVDDGDIRHPDGLVERGQQIIASNRVTIFADRAYRVSRHPLQIASVAFRGPDVAVADGKWELTGVRDQPDRQGPFTWVLIRRDGSWKIAAWRYADKLD